jgi:hypothetical protein
MHPAVRSVEVVGDAELEDVGILLVVDSPVTILLLLLLAPVGVFGGPVVLAVSTPEKEVPADVVVPPE